MTPRGTHCKEACEVLLILLYAISKNSKLHEMADPCNMVINENDSTFT